MPTVDQEWLDEDEPTLKQRTALSESQKTTPFVLGMVLIGIGGLVAIVVVACLVPESTGVITSILTLCGVLIAAMATLTKVSEATTRMDGRVDEALVATAKKNYQRGLENGRLEEHVRSQAKAEIVAERVVEEKAIQLALGHAEGKAEERDK